MHVRWRSRGPPSGLRLHAAGRAPLGRVGYAPRARAASPRPCRDLHGRARALDRCSAWRGMGRARHGRRAVGWRGPRRRGGRFSPRGARAPLLAAGRRAAMREPWRIALGLLARGWRGPRPSRDLREVFSAEEGRIHVAMLERGVHSPRTTSMGRLFDAVAALSGVHGAGGLRGAGGHGARMRRGGRGGRALSAATGGRSTRGGGLGAAARVLLSERGSGASHRALPPRFHATLAGLAESIARARAACRAWCSRAGASRTRAHRAMSRARLRATGLRGVLHRRRAARTTAGCPWARSSSRRRWLEEEHDVSRHPR